MKVLRFLFVFTFLLLSSAGCGNLLYLSKLGWHQGSIHFHSVPVQEVLVDERSMTGEGEDPLRPGGEKLWRGEDGPDEDQELFNLP